MKRRHGLVFAACTSGFALFAGMEVATAQGVPPPGGGGASHSFNALHPGDATRICDPKLDGGGASVSYHLDPSYRKYAVTITVLAAAGQVVATPFVGREVGKVRLEHFWDGKTTAGSYANPGHYTIRVTAINAKLEQSTADFELDIVRLGVRQITAAATVANNEWQTVYFRKLNQYKFYATPATGEWLSRDETGDLADLDLNDGSPRPRPAIWTRTDEPVLETTVSGTIYDNDWYNYPVCYRAGATPQFTLKFGTAMVRSDGTAGGVNYPVAGFDLRVVGRDQLGTWVGSNVNITPGSTDTLVGAPVNTNAGRVDRGVLWSFEYRPTGSATWSAIPGNIDTQHRIYTILDQPYWATGGSGTQYSGPWVEVLDYLCVWQKEFNLTLDTQEKIVKALVLGYFGQQGNLLTAIEDVHYDCPSEGGDGGATHYGGTGTVHLSHLLNNHADGIYVNCTDCATTTSVMLAMLGVPNMELFHLGSMTLRAIWGIGCDDYTLDLWGGSHGFSYHHIITRDGGTNISDACLCVDEDGSPDALPGTPGYNYDRDWNRYEALLAKANISTYTQKLPKVD